ncbi:alkaline phosphatase [Haloechinothrix sp. LS1_15]|nr:alkaline phosphatase [Haloechinothrix sp. LS1_15]
MHAPRATARSHGSFRHGVASGDPLPEAVVLWTRVTPTEDAYPGSGAGPRVAVHWQVATDAEFDHVVARGTVTTGGDRDHTVKVDVTGLAPGTWYYYRFRHAGETSPVGRTRTAPAAHVVPERLRMGVVSCSNWEAGLFAGYGRLADRGDVDVVVCLGDYLYEYETGYYNAAGSTVRPHRPEHELLDLADYRMRHAQHKTDPDLQRLHASCPWVMVWDDHEFANDWWHSGAENHDPETEGSWDSRHARALQAYREWTPVRFGQADRIHRRLRFGTLAELTMLDLRSYRDEPITTNYADAHDPERGMTGPEQMRWLQDGLAGSEAQWKLIGNSVMFSPFLMPPFPDLIGKPLAELTGLVSADGGIIVHGDQWDGYQHDRNVLISFLADHGITDTVFLSGDIHTSWANEVPVDAGAYPLTPRVATELVCPSVTSDNLDDILGVPPRTTSVAAEKAVRLTNRHVRWVELDSHGYTVLDVRPDRVKADWYFVDRLDRDSEASFATSVEIPAGSNRIVVASEPIG